MSWKIATTALLVSLTALGLFRVSVGGSSRASRLAQAEPRADISRSDSAFEEVSVESLLRELSRTYADSHSFVVSSERYLSGDNAENGIISKRRMAYERPGCFSLVSADETLLSGFLKDGIIKEYLPVLQQFTSQNYGEPVETLLETPFSELSGGSFGSFALQLTGTDVEGNLMQGVEEIRYVPPRRYTHLKHSCDRYIQLRNFPVNGQRTVVELGASVVNGRWLLLQTLFFVERSGSETHFLFSEEFSNWDFDRPIPMEFSFAPRISDKQVQEIGQ